MNREKCFLVIVEVKGIFNRPE